MLSFLYEEDDSSDFIEKLVTNKELDWEELPPGEEGVIEDYWSYMGSLTNEACTEDYMWVIATEIGEVSDDQIEYFQSMFFDRRNSRSTKPLNNRIVYLVGEDLSDDFAGVLGAFAGLAFFL
jgi:carbonic anhydrase